MNETIRFGISTCLLGKKVRWDGGHKLDGYISQTLGRFVEFVPVCPEVEAGFGVPRESMRLVGNPQSPRLMTFKDKTDLTARMFTWSKKRVKDLKKENLCGFILKTNSPSCGMGRVNVYSGKGMPVKKGIGLFAREFMNHFPLVPVQEDGRLHDPATRENFIERVFTLKRWRDTLANQKTLKGLVDFHAYNKLLILSHSPGHAGKMGKLIAAGKTHALKELFSQYENLLINALIVNTTTHKNLNVLRHMMGYLKKQLTGDEKRELLEIFDHYQNGFVPLLVPITLINHYVRKYDQPYLKTQTYLNPHPIELKLKAPV